MISAAAPRRPIRSFPTWGVSLIALAVALATATGIELLYERADARQAVAYQFDRLLAMAERAHALEDDILAEPGELILAAGFSATENPFLNTVDDLARARPGPETARLRAAYLRYQAALERLSLLALAGQRAEAERFYTEEVDPACLAFMALVEETRPAAHRDAAAADRDARVGAYTALVLAAGLVGLLWWGSRRYQWSAEALHAEKQKLANEQGVLWRVGALAIADGALDWTVRQIARATLGIVNAESCSIELWRPERNETELAAEETIDEWPGVAETGTRFDLAEWPCTRWALEHRTPLRLQVDDPRLSSLERQSLVSGGTRSLLILPLAVGGACLGTLALYARQENGFDDHAVWLGQELAAQTALAVQNAQSRERIRLHVAEQERLLRLSQEAETRYRTLVEQIPAITYLETIDDVERSCTYLYVSPQVEPLLGYKPEEWLEDPHLWEAMLHPDDRAAALAEDARTDETGEPFRLEYRVLARDGRVVWLYDEAVLVNDEEGRPRYWHGIKLDVTAQKEAEEKLRQSEAEFRLLFSRNPHPTWVYDRETLRFLAVNETAVAHYGYARDEFLAMRITDIRPAEEVALLMARIGGERPTVEHVADVRHLTKDGRVIDVEVSSHLLDFRGRPAALVIAQDITARHTLEARLAHQAYHDALTGLPNRALFLNRLSHALDRALSVAVLFVDLDDFKVINDTLGHTAGDALLLDVGERLQRALRPGDTIARLGGDEFTILLEASGEAEAIAVAERLSGALEEAFTVDGHELVVSPSIGIAVGAPGRDRSDELLRQADVAMYEAKQRGKARWAIYSPAMDARSWNRLALEAELRRAIGQDQLRVHYQPLVALDTGRITEVEALVRWEHPTRGLVSPAEFIPLAEESGLIVPLGLWVLEQACRQVAAWQRADPRQPPLVVGVNLSARQFQQPTLVADVARTLRESGLSPRCLKLEITETVAMRDIAATVATLRELKALGAQLAIDDFGTGYSGLSYLQRCPIDTLKIDRSYIDGLGSDAGDTAMVRAVMAFAKTLGLSVTAEGVETADQVEELLTLGCDRGQGFYFARPQVGEEIERLLDRDRAWAAPIAAVAD